MTAMLPPSAELPEPPPWGWVAKPDKLTVNEMDEIKAVSGVSVNDFQEEPIKLGAYIAVAYARRLDKKLYDWSVAGDLPLDVLRHGWPTDEADEATADAEFSAAQEAAADGEAVDPA